MHGDSFNNLSSVASSSVGHSVAVVAMNDAENSMNLCLRCSRPIDKKIVLCESCRKDPDHEMSMTEQVEEVT